MTAEERKKYLKLPVDVVITRSCKTKKNADSKLEDFEVGDKVSITHEFADELISLNKAVVAGSNEHKVWTASEEKKKKSPAQNAPSVNDLLVDLVKAIRENTDAVAEALGKKK